MPGQPKFTRTVSVNVEIIEAEVGPVNVARYQVTPGDLTDGDRTPLLADIKGRAIIEVIQDEAGDLQVTVTPVAGAEFEVVQATAADLQAEATPRPMGSIIAKGSVTTTDTYAVVATRTVTSAKTFQLAKILVSCPEDVMYLLRWNAGAISAEVYVTGGIPFTDWFPWDYYTMLGDGAKAFDIQVKYPAGGAAATCHAEIVGEPVN